MNQVLVKETDTSQLTDAIKSKRDAKLEVKNGATIIRAKSRQSQLNFKTIHDINNVNTDKEICSDQSEAKNSNSVRIIETNENKMHAQIQLEK